MKGSTKSELVRRFLSRLALTAGCAVAVGISGADLASAFTVHNGNTEFMTSGYTFTTPLEMDGGYLIIDDTLSGVPIVVSATNSVLGRGMINFRIAQLGTPTFEFFGTTTVPGAPSDTFPADGMYLRAGTELSRADYVIRGVFVQSGTGQLSLLGSAHLIVEVGSVYYFDNDLGIQSTTIPGLSEPKLVVRGGSLIKGSGTGVSEINVPIEHTAGRFELASGHLALIAGGTYRNAEFHADPLGTNPLQSIAVGGGTHEFSGQTRAASGAFRIEAGSTVRTAISPPPLVDQWLNDTLSTMTIEGTLDVTLGSPFANNGQIATTGSGRITGLSIPGSTSFYNGGSFIGEFRWTGSPGAYTDGVSITNVGSFVVDFGKTAEVGSFQNGGSLLVNGTLTTSAGNRLDHFAGELKGSGIINGDVFVEGDPLTAVFAAVAPGNSPGTMTINGAYTQGANGELELEMAGNQPGQYDVVDASGGLTFNEGLIRFETPTFYVGAVGDELDFFAGNPVSIGPNVVIIDNTGLELAFDPATGMATVPEPDALALLASGLLGLSGLVSSRRGRSHNGCARGTHRRRFQC